MSARIHTHSGRIEIDGPVAVTTFGDRVAILLGKPQTDEVRDQLASVHGTRGVVTSLAARSDYASRMISFSMGDEKWEKKRHKIVRALVDESQQVLVFHAAPIPVSEPTDSSDLYAVSLHPRTRFCSRISLGLSAEFRLRPEVKLGSGCRKRKTHAVAPLQ